MNRLLFLGLIIVSTLTACKYSLKGISIDQNAKTFNVTNFKMNAPTAPPTLGQDFAEALIDKFRRETPLTYTNGDADYEFSGTITRFAVQAVAPQPGETTALNRLNFSTSIDFVDNIKEDADWTQNFSYFYDFDAQTNLIDIQDEAIEAINDQVLEDIFKKAFTNW